MLVLILKINILVLKLVLGGLCASEILTVHNLTSVLPRHKVTMVH